MTADSPATIPADRTTGAPVGLADVTAQAMDRIMATAARSAARPAVQAAAYLHTVILLHADGGVSQGYTGDGYGYIDHCCMTCGTFGEYGQAWPCDTYTAAKAALDVLTGGAA